MRWGWQGKEDFSGSLPSLTFEMKLQEDEAFQGTWVGYGFLLRIHSAGWDSSVFPAWLLCVTGTVHFVPGKNEPFNKPLTAFAMSAPCTCPAVCGPYPMVICEIFYSLSHVNSPNSGKKPVFLKKLREGIKKSLELSPFS